MGVDVDTISLLRHGIPDNTAVLVVADPKSRMDTVEKKKIIDFMNSGGNAILYGEPGKQDMLNPLLRSIGVSLDQGIVVIPSRQDLPNSFIAGITRTGLRMAGEEQLYRAIHKDAPAGVYMSGAANVSFREANGFIITP